MTLEGHSDKMTALKEGNMTREELVSCLEDRPCQACTHHSAAGCRIWTCAFDETKGGWSEVETLAAIRERKEDEEDDFSITDKYIKARVYAALNEISMHIELLKAGFTAKEGGNENVVNGLNCALAVIETYQDAYKTESEGEV